MSEGKLQGFGKYLKQARLDAGFRTQAEAVAALQEREGCCLSQSLLAQYETGRILDPNPRLLQAAARLYGKDYLELAFCLFREKYAPAEGWDDGLAVERLGLWQASFSQPNLVGGVPGFQADQLRAKASLVQLCEVLDLRGKVMWEKKDRNKNLNLFWILAPNLRPSGEGRPFLEVVAYNLNRGMKYEHFIAPRREEAFRAYKKMLRQRTSRKVCLDEQVRGYRLDKNALTLLWTDYVVANPYDGDPVVFQNLRYEGKTAWCFRLQPADAWEFLAYWRLWVGTAKLVE